MKRQLLGAMLLVTIFSTSALANTPPVISAGNDTTIGIGYRFNFQASAEDDGLPNPMLETTWKQIAGPDTGMTIRAHTSTLSRVEVTAAGVYTFELTAFDGELTVKDTVVITVRAALQFLVFTPSAGQQIQAGSTVSVTWQMDPVSAVNIDLSTDGGKTLSYLAGPVVPTSENASWEWAVPDTLSPSSECIIQVQYYNDHNRIAQSGVFSVVAKSNVRRGYRPFPKARGDEHYSFFAIDGRCLDPAVLSGHPGAGGPAPSRIVIRHGGTSATFKAVVAP